MKSMLTKSTLFSLVVGLNGLFLSCGDQNSKSASQVSSENNQPQASYSYINSSENELRCEITRSGDDITLRMPEGQLFGVKKDDKRKYYDHNDQYQYAVKYKGTEGFKLRDGNEALLWKVKISSDKIKVADNEEMNDAFTIRLYDNQRVKLTQDDTELESIRYQSGEPNIRIKDQYMARNLANSHALGILLIEKMTETEKYIISAELLQANQ